MSDYMFKLESHLSPEQNRVVALVEDAAARQGVNAFLTGGAMRDMLGGFLIRDLDFTVEAKPAKIVQALEKAGAVVVEENETRRAVEVRFPDGVRAEVGMAHRATYGRPGSKPKIEPATIHDDLVGRDFTINSIALSLVKRSRGLLLDPQNGLGDLERRELRTNSNYGLFDDPSRLLRILRLKARMGFDLDPRTQAQYANAREAGMEAKIPAVALLRELRQMAREQNAPQVVELLEKEGLLVLFSPALTGPKLNGAGFAKLERVRAMVPFGADFQAESFGLFLFLLTEKLSPKEKSKMVESLGMSKEEVADWQKLESRSAKLEKELASSKLNRASLVYQRLKRSPGEQVLFLAIRSNQRLVHDRIRNYLGKYLEMALEVTDKEVAQTGVEIGSPGFASAREDFIRGRLDGRNKKPAPPPEPLPGPVSVLARR